MPLPLLFRVHTVRRAVPHSAGRSSTFRVCVLVAGTVARTRRSGRARRTGHCTRWGLRGAGRARCSFPGLGTGGAVPGSSSPARELGVGPSEDPRCSGRLKAPVSFLGLAMQGLGGGLHRGRSSCRFSVAWSLVPGAGLGRFSPEGVAGLDCRGAVTPCPGPLPLFRVSCQIPAFVRPQEVLVPQAVIESSSSPVPRSLCPRTRM